MKKVYRKLVALISTFALALPMIVAPSITAYAEESFAFLQFASADWAVSSWGGEDGDGVTVSNTPVNGPGTYTVGLEFDNPVSGIAFFDVEVKDGASLYPGAYMNIDSIKVNGDEIEFGATYTNDEEGNSRTNLYNEWVSDLPADARTNGADDATPTPVDNGLSDISSIEVTFTLSVPQTDADIIFAAADWGVQFWGGEEDGVTATVADVTGYGTYTVGLDFANPAAGMAFFAVRINNGQFVFPNSYMQIDSVVINGDEIDIAKTYSNYEEGALRTNLYNEWVSEVTEGVTADGGSADVTPTPVDNSLFDEISSIEVTFTLMSGVPFGGSDVDEDYEIPSAFNAFLMFQDNGGGEWSNFAPGVGNDMMILGDGVWEVSITREQAGGTGQAIADESGFVFLVDIEELGKAMAYIGTLREDPNNGDALTDTDAEVSVEIYVDGDKVSGVRNENIKFGDIEGNGRLRLELVNTWGTGTIDNPVAMTSRLNPNDEIKVVFTLKGTGFNSDFDWDSVSKEEAPVEAVPLPAQIEPAAADQVADDSDGGFPVWAIILIVLVVIGIVCAVVVVSMKKAKK
ncbi:MAG: hypothetical protein FWC09_09420 [Lachnospiraceae bacterium]|nr:hypothetical protein [Lachnospiraceae bacterium]